jgi:hypothetical protein
MEFLTSEMYTGAFGSLCKALAQSGQQQISDKKDTFWVDFDILVNLPKPNEIITRCFVSYTSSFIVVSSLNEFYLGSTW